MDPHHMDIGDVIARLKHVEDIEALKQLKYRYCRAADDNYDGDLVASFFTEDGVWDGGDVGRGRNALFNSPTMRDLSAMGP